MSLTPQQITIVQSSFHSLQPMSATAAELFYKRLFEIDPAIAPLFKRGMKGVYQHCKEKHLHRYLAEFDFRYSNRVKLGVDDKQRAGKALLGLKGKRLKYRGFDSIEA